MNGPPHRRRIDRQGRASRGSQLQVQIYVNRLAGRLDEAVLPRLPDDAGRGASIEWVSPLEKDRFKEFRDRKFLKALRKKDLWQELRGFWPCRGPRWDALGLLKRPTGASPGILLVEGKSYLGEINGGGCKAGGRRRETIKGRLNEVKRAFGVADDVNWLSELYQYANQLALIYFFRRCAGTDAWLVNLCFFDDPHRPTTEDRWKEGLVGVKRRLGFDCRPIPHSVDVFLRAQKREVLTTGHAG
jgi:hypothetical protein